MSDKERPRLHELAADCLDGELPVAVRAVDLDDADQVLRLASGPGGMRYKRLLALVRRGGEPLGWVSLPVERDGTVRLDEVTRAAAVTPIARAHLDEPSAADDGSPLVSVIVATCADADATVGCVRAIKAAAEGPCETIVVENRPCHSRVARALEQEFGQDASVRYVEELRPGLACARNAGLHLARGDLVAFTDDDVLVDPTWLRAIRAAFAADPRVACVTGMIAPLELNTPAQLLTERFAGYGKGFVARTYSLRDPPADQPLFPYTAGYFCSGANLAFRTDALRALGGFDPALGTGTPARGCEDLDICIRTLNSGGRLTYEPKAIVWHRHPATHAHMRRRVFDYGAALGAMLTKHIVLGPDRRTILARVPQAIIYYLSSNSRKNAGRGKSFPKGLNRLELAGILYGPLAYLASRLEAAR